MGPFVILALVWFLVVNRHLTEPLHHALRHGELFIPASVMNVEAVLTLRELKKARTQGAAAAGLTICALAALGGAICYGVTAALTEAPVAAVTVGIPTLNRLSDIVTSMSFWEFIQAFTIGTIAVMLVVHSKTGST